MKSICTRVGIALLALSSALGAQRLLPDHTTVAVTSQGLFVVPRTAVGTSNDVPDLFAVATAEDFGLTGGAALHRPRIEWIRNSVLFLVTTKTGPDGPGALYRVALGHDGALRSVEHLRAGDFDDLDYAYALDVLYVLESSAGRVLSLARPDAATGDDLAVWNSNIDVGQGRALAVQDTRHPLEVFVMGSAGIQRAFGGGGVPQLFSQSTEWDRIETHATHSDIYALESDLHNFGVMIQSDLPGGVIGVNQSNQTSPSPSDTCHPAHGPQDVVSDMRPESDRGLIVITDRVHECWMTTPSGPNHLIWFPAFWLATVDHDVPGLLTPVPRSGIAGLHPDIVHVVAAVPDLSHIGWPGTSADGQYRPLVELGFPPNGLSVRLDDAPPTTPALLSIEVVAPGAPLDVFAPLYLADDLSFLLSTDAQGNVGKFLPFPAEGVPAGLRFRFQWTLADPGGDLLLSNKAFYRAGRHPSF